ncbi:MAG: methyltransferase domain-containing protein [Alphaproteobacteria bacterium]|nr:methyltransferase domain-containing protein [Alphaproteobacteria bacterium]
MNISVDGSILSNESIRACSLDELVAELPEIYQPIYGHPKLSTHASRQCKDRLFHIAQIYRVFEARLKRPLRVLDLGCAQGFFSLSLAKIGATVLGVDFQPVNIAVCNALAAEHPELNIRFQAGLIEEAIARIEKDEYDLVLGLSVFHHIVHKSGIATVQKMLAALAAKTAVSVFEMALANEPPSWAASQPQNPRQLLSGFAFVHELAYNATHLSDIPRPLYVASNRYWYFSGQAGVFDTVKTESHVFADNASLGTRRYFFGEGRIVKLFHLDRPDRRSANLREHCNEVSFLKNYPARLKAPRLVLQGQSASEAWLVREQLPGEMLIDRIRFGKTYDAALVVRDIVEQLATLESVELYHDDLRIWNILIGSDGHAALIDYGAIDKNKKDCAWPHNVFLSFIIFIHEITGGRIAKPDPLRAPLLNPDVLPEPYRSAVWEMLEQPPSEWSFAFLRDRILRPSSDNPAKPHAGFAMILDAMETACWIYHDRPGNLQHQARWPELRATRVPPGEPSPQPSLDASPAITRLSSFWH